MRSVPTTRARCPYDAYLQLRVLRVSDDDYWKDFPGEVEDA